jgi:hypothetical protein
MNLPACYRWLNLALSLIALFRRLPHAVASDRRVMCALTDGARAAKPARVCPKECGGIYGVGKSGLISVFMSSCS